METTAEDLLKLYNANYKAVTEIAADRVTKIDIPVFNTISSLSKRELATLLKQKRLVAAANGTHFNCLVIIALTEVTICKLLREDFYNEEKGFFVHSTDLLIKNVCKLISYMNYELYVDPIEFSEEQYEILLSQLRRFEASAKNAEVKSALTSVLRCMPMNRLRDRSKPKKNNSSNDPSVVKKPQSQNTSTKNLIDKSQAIGRTNSEKENVCQNSVKPKNHQTGSLLNFFVKSSANDFNQNSIVSKEITVINLTESVPEKKVALPLNEKKRPQNAFEFLMSSAKKKKV